MNWQFRDEGRAGRRLAEPTCSASAPQPAHRHRAAARSFRHRPLFRGAPPPDGLSMSIATSPEILQRWTTARRRKRPTPSKPGWTSTTPASTVHRRRVGRARRGRALRQHQSGDRLASLRIAAGVGAPPMSMRRSRRARARAAWLGEARRPRPRAYLYALARLSRSSALFAVLESARQRQADPRDARHRRAAGRAPLLSPRRLGAADGERVPDHEPVGVCGQIIPWNFPLLMLAWKIAPALAPATRWC
jgi:hypothetical protein